MGIFASLAVSINKRSSVVEHFVNLHSPVSPYIYRSLQYIYIGLFDDTILILSSIAAVIKLTGAQRVPYCLK